MNTLPSLCIVFAVSYETKISEVLRNTYLFHLHSVYQNIILLIIVIVIEEPSIKHDRVVFLSNLVRLRQVTECIVFPVKFDLRQNATTQSQRCFHCLVQTVFVKHWKHTW